MFELQLDDPSEPPQSSLNEKECVCSCSDCATDDTGYGTDTDLHTSFNNLDLKHRDPLDDFCNVNDVLNSSFASCLDDRISHDFVKAEEDIDSLFQFKEETNDNKFITDFDMPDFTNDLTLDIGNYFATETLNFETRATDTTRKVAKEKSGGYTRFPSINMSETKKCECDKKNSPSKHSIEVNVKLRHQQLPDGKLSAVDLCELILGIVPGHYGSSQSSSSSSSSSRRKDRRVKIRGLVPTGLAAKYSEIKVGRCFSQIRLPVHT